MTEVANPIDWKNVRKILAEQPSHYGQTKEFKDLFGDFNDPFPNMKEIEPDKFWGTFSQYGVGDYQGFRQIIFDRNRPVESVHYFIYWNGTGFAIHVDWTYPNKPEWTPKFYSFALCEHIRKSTLDTNRGWHEGHCTKCGLQMNYDSSD